MADLIFPPQFHPRAQNGPNSGPLLFGGAFLAPEAFLGISLRVAPPQQHSAELPSDIEHVGRKNTSTATGFANLDFSFHFGFCWTSLCPCEDEDGEEVCKQEPAAVWKELRVLQGNQENSRKLSIFIRIVDFNLISSPLFTTRETRLAIDSSVVGPLMALL